MSQSMRAFWAASIIALGMAGPLAVAQGTGGARAGTADQQVAEPSEEQLHRYASAVKKVSAVAADYQPKFQQAPDAVSKQAVRVEADQKMVDAVEADGMSVSEYNGISLAVRKDPDLRKQVEYLVNQQE